MPAIDLRNCDIRIKDGYQMLGAINNGAGYSIGATTCVVDGFVGAVTTGDLVTFAGGTQEYTITAHTETSSNTTSITFTPALVQAVADNDVVTVGPHFIEVKVGEGNLTYSEKREIIYVLDRGVIDTTKLGNDQPMEASLAFTWEFLKGDIAGGEDPSVEDALKQINGASTWVSSETDDPCAPYSVDIELLNLPPGCAAVKAEKIILPYFRHESLDHDVKNSQVSISGKCNAIVATVDRFTPNT